MTRHPLHFSSNEDRETYRKWMRTLACVYGAIIVLAIGGVSLRGNPTSNVAAATTTNALDVARLGEFDR